MELRTLDEIRTSILEQYAKYLPNLDISIGAPERDMFVEAPIAGIIQPIWIFANYVAKLYAPHVFYSELEDVDIDNYAVPYQVDRIESTRSSGQVTFFTFNEPEDDIIIPIGTKVGTVVSPPIEFQTTTEGLIFVASNLSFFNVTENRWEVTVNVEAIEAGPDFRAGATAISKLLESVTGIEGCINNFPVTGGQPEETNKERLDRITRKFQGRDLSNTIGLKSFMEAFSETVNIVGANDILMVRDEGLGGSIDIYMLGEELDTITDTVTITSEGLSNPINVNYTSISLILDLQPVAAITSFIINEVSLDSAFFSFIEDAGSLKKSPRALDKVELIPTAGIQKWGFDTEVTIAASTGFIDDRTSGLQKWGFNTVTPISTASGLTNSSSVFYGCQITVDGGAPQDILIVGNAAQTMAQVLDEINIDLNEAVGTWDTSGNGFFEITSDSIGSSSTIVITDGGAVGQSFDLFDSLINANVSAETAEDGTNGTAHTAVIYVDSAANNISIDEYEAPTLTEIIDLTNVQLTGAVASFDDTDNGYILVTSDSTGETSTIEITDVDLFSSLLNANNTVEEAADGGGIAEFNIDDLVSVTYNYNKLLSDITNTLNDPANHYHGRDYLVREMDTISIDLYAEITEVAGQDFARVRTAVETAVANYIETVKTESTLELADIVGVIKNNGGVDNINLETISITSVGGGTKIGTDLFFDKNSYMIEGVFDIIKWVTS